MAVVTNKKCPCYSKLPVPRCELDYYLWIPGFVVKPASAKASYSEDPQECHPHSEQDEDMAEALAEMVEEDDMREEFNAVAKNGLVDTKTALYLARKLGLSPSINDISKFEEENGPNLTFEHFQKFLMQCTHPEDDVEKMTNFFAQYDTADTGYLTKKQIGNLLTVWGEPLTQEELNNFTADFELGDQIDYRELCKRIMQSH